MSLKLEDLEKLNVTQRLLYKTLFKKSFYDFVKFFWDCCDPAPFIDGKLIQFYCESYQYMVRHWVEYDDVQINVPQPSDDLVIIDVRQNKNNYNINVPPRHSKSMIFSVLGPVYLWINEPVLAATVSHESSLATESNQKRQKLINSEKFKFFFPEIVLDANSANMIRDTRGGQLYAISRNALLGRGVSIISNDDITNAETARLDKKEMEASWSYYTQTMPSRINDPSKYMILNIQQRLSPNDITGRIMADQKLSETYCFIVLPCQFRKKTILVCPISGELITYEKDSYLWPERFGDYQGLKAQIGDRIFEAQYMQNPYASDDTIIKESMIVEKDPTDIPGWNTTTNEIDQNAVDIIYSSNDLPCKKTDKSDYLGSVICYRVKKVLYITDCIEEKQNIIDSINHVTNLHLMYPSIIQIVEDKAGGIQLLDLVSDEIPGLQPFNPGIDSKEQRMEMALPWIYSGNVIFVKTVFDEKTNKWVLSKNLQNLKDRLLGFPMVSHDDICDAFSMLILYVFNDAKFSVYGKSFNEYNLIDKSSIEYDYSTIFVNKIGDEWKLLDIGIKYDLSSQLIVLREKIFTAGIEQGLNYLKEFAPDKNVFIDCSDNSGLNGIYTDKVIMEKYEPEDLGLSVGKLNVALGNKKVLLDNHCKQTQSDLENFKYNKKDTSKFRTNSDGFVRCIRSAMRYYGGI